MENNYSQFEERLRRLEEQQLLMPIDPPSIEALNQAFISAQFSKFVANSVNATRLTLGQQKILTIASGVVEATQSIHSIETEGGAATDDLDTINVPENFEGMILVISAESNSRTVVAKDGTGNLRLAGDFTMDNSRDRLTLIRGGVVWFELCRSDNDV